MGIKEQFKKLKENWLIAALVLVLFLVVSGGSNVVEQSLKGFSAPMAEMGVYDRAEYATTSYYGNDDFAPEIEERVVIKTANLATELERGTFQDSEVKLKAIISSSDSYLLNENVRKYGTKRKAYYHGSYQLKVDTTKYAAVISQLKEIGELQSFSENQEDVTGKYTDLQIELDIEKSRLERYHEMYAEAKEVEDKIELNDRIFNQERRIKYLEDRIENIDKRVEYSTVYFTMTEKRSDYVNVVFVKFSELVKNMVNSFNSLLSLLFVIVPWLVAIGIGAGIYRLVKKK